MIKSTLDFGRALCRHFNLPAGQVCNLKIDTEMGKVFGASLTIHLKPTDLTAIAALMEQDTPSKPKAEPDAVDALACAIKTLGMKVDRMSDDVHKLRRQMDDVLQHCQ